MVRNEEKYAQAVQLRRRGFTLAEVAKYCGVAKSTASKWLQNEAFSQQVTRENTRRAGAENAKRLRLVQKAQSHARAERYNEVAHAARVSFRHYKKDPQFMAGLMLYLGAGDQKDDRVIKLASTKIEIHTIFQRFAKEYLGVEENRVHFLLVLYNGAREAACIKKWQRATGLPRSQFYKVQYVKNQPVAKNKPLHSGVGNTIICSTVQKRTLTEWLTLATKELA